MLDNVGGRAVGSLNQHTGKYLRVGQANSNGTPLQMLVSQQTKFNQRRLILVVLGLFTLAVGLILSSIPWVDYLILKNLKLWNGTLSFYYWQKPGVMRLTKVFVFNVTNPDGFLNGQKPKLEEVGPFVYREDMEKANIKFHDNGTVTFQHKKILHFVPELSVPRNVKLVVPNIPLLTLTSKSAELPGVMRLGLSLALKTLYRMSAFNTITPDELLFGYDERLTNLASKFYPRGKRPPSKMALLLGRNSTLLNDVATIHTGMDGWENFGLMTRLNGLDHLPYWDNSPCNSIRASEGSFFPPREVTKSDVVHVWDKDLCRSWALRYRGETVKYGIPAGYYTPDDDMFTSGDKYPPNKCFCQGNEPCPPDGFQNISPCQFDAPVYLSFPHFYGVTDPEILSSVEGLKPNKEKHETVFKIQDKIGVPLEARVRVQLNLKVTQANLTLVKKFPSIMFPVVWVEEGAEELTPEIYRWIYMGIVLAPWVVPTTEYSMILAGMAVLIIVFVRTYKDMVFTRENIELGKEKLRRGSSLLAHPQARGLLILRDSYSILPNNPSNASFMQESQAEEAEV